MNIIFVTMIYGAALPLLFPICFLSIFILYILEIYMLFYVFKKPPTYDENLNIAFLEALKYAPLILLAFGFWQLSNMQLLPTSGLPNMSAGLELSKLQ